MNLRRNIIIVLITVLAFATASAKIAIWDVAPKYENLNRYYGAIYAFQQNGKWGLVQSGNKEIIPASCDFITPFTNGYALAGIKDGSRYLLEYIINDDGSVTTLADKYYLPASNQYVSEGKLAVVNKNGKYGYISADGHIIVKCQFDNGLPFKEGWAPVKQGNYMKYISENYDKNQSRSILTVDFHYGDMTLASCFQNGKAVVAYNKDFAIISKNGQKVKKINDTEFKQLYKKNNAQVSASDNGFNESSRYEIISQNDKCGLKEGEEIVLIPQFESLPKQFNDNTILALSKGKYGVLKIMDGSVTSSILSDEIDIDRKGNISPVSINYSIPASLSNVRVLLDLGDGAYNDLSSQLSKNGANSSLTVSPIVSKNADSCVIKGIVENNGIILADFEKVISLNYPVKLRLTAPGPSTIRAGENDMATFSSTIFNDSNKEISVTAKWSTGKTMMVTIPAHGSKTVSDAVYVPSDFEQEIILELSTGEKTKATISFHTFF